MIVNFLLRKDVPGLSQTLQHIDPEKLSEMAMVDIAYEILKGTNEPCNFRELMNEIAALRGMTDEQMMAMIAQVYTEINIDGRFICVGDNTWGLKRWYPTEAVEESQEGGKRKKILLDDDLDDYDDDLDEELEEDFEDDDILELEDDDEYDEADEDADDDLVDDEEIFDDEELEGEVIEDEETEDL